MRTIKEIQAQLLDAIGTASGLNPQDVLTTSEQTISGANSTSKVAIWRLWVWVFAYVLYLHERIVAKNAENSRPHTVRWYREQCMNFCDGLGLVWKDGQFQYDLTNVADAESRKIIDCCSVLESNNGELVIKVANSPTTGTIKPLTPAELLRFKAYMNQIKDAGNRLRFISQEGDDLKIGLTVYVDPLIIDLETGKLLNTSEEVYPIRTAIDTHLENLEFDGALVKEFLRDSLQKATGVKLPIINELQSRYLAFPYQNVGEWKVAESGYYRLSDANLKIEYKVM